MEILCAYIREEAEMSEAINAFPKRGGGGAVNESVSSLSTIETMIASKPRSSYAPYADINSPTNMETNEGITHKDFERGDYRDAEHLARDTMSPPRYQTGKSIMKRVTTSPGFMGMNGCLMLVNILVLLVSVNKILTLRQYCPQIPYTPAKNVLQYHRTALDLTSFNPYAGERTPDMDKAWEELKIYEVWRATKDELVRSGAYENRSLSLEHGGYMAIMRAYHELHCLDWMKRAWDPTQPLMTEHLDHCLDYIRQGAMCKADLTVGSFYWWPEDREEKERARRPNFNRECVNWDRLEDFLSSRRMRFVNGVPEAPIGYDGKPIVVPSTDGLHDLNDLVLDRAQSKAQ